MSRRREPLLRPRQARYLDKLLPPRDALRAGIEREAARRGWRIVGPQVGRLYEALTARLQEAHVVELGCGIGYGTLHLARGAAAGSVTAVEADGEALALAREHLDRAGVGDRVELVHGEPLELAARLSGPFDVAVVDAAASEPRRSLDRLLPQLRVGGTVVVVGLLAGGRVAEPELRDDEDAHAAAMEAFNPYLTIHPQLASVVLPLGDGVGLAVKRRPTIRELGGPY